MSGFPPNAAADGKTRTEFLPAWLALMARHSTKMLSEDSLRSAHLSATGSIALRPWSLSACTTYQSLHANPAPQPSTSSGAYGTPIRSLPSSSLFTSWKSTSPAPPAMPLFTKEEIDKQWTPITGPNNRPLRDGFNATTASIAARNTLRNIAPAVPPRVTVEVESFATVSEEIVPETQIPTGTPELNPDMSDNLHNLEIFHQHSANDESTDNAAIMGPPRMNHTSTPPTSTTTSTR
ncbi:hypothetical protein Q9L58_010331 [Maublancomyces gigas]|uniref:Uncharacterized protein n=1 Tax=Discina gigas TaxID=1032678 RepID=A0ABR3G4S4_9PEZI